MSAIRYRSEIDGLRAVAVLPVILFHMGYSWISGGFIGVDVFFVISGYLITSILAKEINSGTFTFREFWARRIRRILPTMLVVVSATLTVTYFAVFKGDHRVIGAQALAGLFSIANLYYWRTTGDYWGTASEESPFLHTWSLSVEEQFYAFFPILMWGVVHCHRKLLPAITVLGALSSLILFLYGVLNNPIFTFYALPTRSWELGIGCYLALSMPKKQSNRHSVLGLVGLGMVIASFFFVPRMNGGLAIGVFGTALILAFGQSGWCRLLLSNQFVVHIGKISYSLYLWHWPVLVFADLFGFKSDKLWLSVPIYLLSLATFHLVEKRTRRRKGAVPVIGICFLVVAGVAAFLVVAPGVYDSSKFSKPVWDLGFDLRVRESLDREFQRIAGMVDVRTGFVHTDAYKTDGIITGPGDGKPQIVVLGDSHGVMWSPTLQRITEQAGYRTAFWSMNAVSPMVKLPLTADSGTQFLSSQDKLAYDKARLDQIARWGPSLVILCVRWSQYRESDTKDLLNFLVNNSGRVLLMEQPPELPFGNRNALQWVIYQGMEPKDGESQYLPMDTALDQASQSLVESIVSSYRECDRIPIRQVYARQDMALVLRGREAVYLDDDHLTAYGTTLASAEIESAIQTALTNVVSAGVFGNVSEKLK